MRVVSRDIDRHETTLVVALNLRDLQLLQLVARFIPIGRTETSMFRDRIAARKLIAKLTAILEP